MEDFGKLRAQYYVFKSSGLFTRGNKVLQIYDQGLIFLTPTLAKSKERESFPFGEQFDISSPDREGKDVAIKTKRQNFTLVSETRERIVADLCYYKDIYDAKYNVPGAHKGGLFEGFRQLIVSDIYTKIPVSMQVTRAGFQVSYDKDAYRSLYANPEAQEEVKSNPRSYAIRYSDVSGVIVLPTGFLIEAKPEQERMVFDGDSINTIVELLDTLPVESIGKVLPLQNEITLKSNILAEEDNFAVPLAIKLPGGLERQARIHVSDSSLILEDTNTSNSISSIDISSILYISVEYHKTKKSTLCVSTPYKDRVKYRLETPALEAVLAGILHSGLVHEGGEIEPILLLPPVDNSAKVFNLENEPLFEQSLVQEIVEVAGLGKPFDTKLHQLMLSLALNSSMKATGFDSKLMGVLTGLLAEYFAVIFKGETEGAKEYETMIDLSKAERAKKDSGTLLDNRMVEVSLYNAYVRMAPLLCVMRGMFRMRSSTPDLSSYLNLVEILMHVVKCRNSVVSYLSSTCLRAMMKVNKGEGEKRLETAGKKWMVRELDIISGLAATVNEFLSKNTKQGPETILPHLHIFGLLSIFDEILTDKKDGGMQSEDSRYATGIIFSSQNNVFLDMLELLLTSTSAPILYQASKIQHDSLSLSSNGSDKDLHQELLLHSTMLLVRHLVLAFSCTSAQQRKLSSQLVALQVATNVSGCALMRRVFPKTLLSKKCVDWKLEAWKEFLDTITTKNFSTPTEQWNQDCREELVAKLTVYTGKFMKIKRAGRRPRWNVEEFGVVYSGLESKCRVGRFYLQDSVEWIKEGDKVKLTAEITDPPGFWNKLVKKYLVDQDLGEKKLILDVMRATYKGNATRIGTIKMLPYFVHILSDYRDKALHLSALRLIYASVKVQDKELLFKNYQQLAKGDGIRCVLGVLARAFGVKEKKPCGKQRTRRCRLVFKILRRILAGAENQYAEAIIYARLPLYPEAKLVLECKENEMLRVIVQVLLHEDERLRKIAVEFIGQHVLSPGLEYKVCGLVDFLVTCLDGPAGKEAFVLLCKIEGICREESADQKAELYNAGLDTSKLLEADKEILANNEKVRESVFLRFLPAPFVRNIVKDFNYEKSYEIFASDNYRQPELVWDKDMRGFLLSQVRTHVAGYIKSVREFVGKKTELIENFPHYSEPFNKLVSYPQLSGEMRSGEYYLNTSKAVGNPESLNQGALVESLEKTLAGMVSDSEHIDFAKLDIILGSFKLALRGPGKVASSSSSIITVLIQAGPKLCVAAKEAANRLYLKNIMKFICKALRIGVASALEETCCYTLAATVLKCWMGYIREAGFATAKVLDAAGIRWCLAVLFEAADKSPTYWSSMEKAERLDLLRQAFEFTYHMLPICRELGYEKEKFKPSIKTALVFSSALKMPKYSKVADVNYSDKPIGEKLMEKTNLYVIYSVLMATESAFAVVNVLAGSLTYHQELLQTGWPWLSLYQTVNDIDKNHSYLDTYFSINVLKAFNLVTFRRLCGPAYKGKSDETLKSFGEVAKKLLSKYIMNQILLDMEVAGEIIKGPGTKTVVGTLQPTCEKLARDIELPYFIWNSETRKELALALQEQISAVVSKSGDAPPCYVKAIAEFEYASYKNELIVDGVFVKMINKDPYMRVEDPFSFITAAIQELDKASDVSKIVSLLDAINNLVVYQKGFELGILSQAAIKALCRFIQCGPPEDSKSWERVLNYGFGVFIEACKEVKQVLGLMESNDFCRALLAPLCSMKNDFLVKRVMGCLEGVVANRDCDAYLMNKGFIIVLLRIVFDESCPKPHRLASFKIIQAVLIRQRAEDKASYFACFVPKHILERIMDLNCTSPSEEESAINSLLSDHADIYLTWNGELRTRTKEILGEECKKVEGWTMDSAQPLWIEIPKEPIIELYINKGEVVVCDVVLSRYISSPAAKLKKPITKLVEALNEDTVRYFLILNQYMSATEADIRETIGALGKASMKVNLGAHVETLEKGLLIMVTALVLTYEQIFRNLFNQNKVTQEKSGKKPGAPKLAGIMPADKIRAILYQGLRSTSCREMNIMLLQLLYLVCEQKDVLGKDELQVITVAVTQRLLDSAKASDKLRKVEEIAALCALHKILDRIGTIKGRDSIVDLVMTKEMLEKMKELYATKKHLMNYIEVLLHRISQAPYYQKILADDLKFELSADCKMDRIVNRKYEPIDKVWRKSPVRVEECKVYEQTGVMEEFELAGEAVMPLISRKVFEKFNLEESCRVMIEAYGKDMKEFKARASAPIQHPFPGKQDSL